MYAGVPSPSNSKHSAHAEQLHSFLRVMGSAIKTVQTLELLLTSLPYALVEELTPMLAPLMLACPAVRLKVAGPISRELLAALGASCSNPCTLDVSAVPIAVVQDLQKIMPSLSHLHVHQFNRPHAHVSVRALASCLSQLSGTALTELNLGPFTPTLGMWTALPQGLTRLHCSLDGGIPDDVRVLASLSHLTYLRHTYHDQRVHRTNRFALRTLADLLALAPQLRSLALVGEADCDGDDVDIPHVMVECTDANIVNLKLLHSAVQAGLVITSHLGAGTKAHGLLLHLWIEDGEDDKYWYKRGIAAYLGSLPCFPAFDAVMVEDLCERMQDSSTSEELLTSFPSLTSLDMRRDYDMFCEDHEPGTLHAFTALRNLTLHGQAEPEDLVELAEICTHVPSLRTLRLACSGTVPAEAQVSLQVMLQAQGSILDVTLYESKAFGFMFPGPPAPSRSFVQETGMCVHGCCTLQSPSRF